MAGSHGQFVWYELVTTDVKAAKAFYAAVVGWGVQDVTIPGVAYTLFTAGDASVCGLMDLPEDARNLGYRPNWLGYVGVNDVDAVADRITQLGGALHVPPKEVPNISRFSVAVDPQFATIAIFKWLNGGQRPAELDALGHVGWHELLAADWETAFAFYAELFGWRKGDTYKSVVGAYQLFSVGGQAIGGIYTKPPAVSVPFWLYYFNVDDIDAAMTRVVGAGGEILDGPIEVPGSNWILRCADPQGAIFALLGKRRKEAIAQAATSQIGWSTEWNGLSLRGKLLVTKVVVPRP